MLALPMGAPVLIDVESAMVIARLTQVVVAVGIAGAVTMCADRVGWTAWLHASVSTALPEEPEPQRLER
jgi:PhoPQ-activated pathogenicity-related protein